MSCRICLESTGHMISPCGCKGSAAFVHPHCIQEWVTIQNIEQCEICHEDFYKREHCSFEPCKYMAGCIRCNREKYHGSVVMITLWVLCLSGILVNFTPYDNYILLDAVTTLTLTVCAIAWGVIHKQDIYDVIVYWKAAASFPYLATCFVEYMISEETCDQRCFAIQYGCNHGCPFYQDLTRRQTQLNNAVLFDMTNVGIILLVRSFFLCFVYMRNTTLLDRPDENERLLSEVDDV